MIENEVYKTGSFIDWLGKEHRFTVAGVVVSLKEEELMLADVIPLDPGNGVFCAIPVDEVKGDGHVRKAVFLGVSICCPEDSKNFDPELGKKIAYNRALCGRLPQRWLATDVPEMITGELVELLVDQEVKLVAAHPERYSKSYAEAKLRYEAECQKQKKQAHDPEQEAFQKLLKVLMLGGDNGLFDLFEAICNSHDLDSTEKDSSGEQ